MPKRKVEVAPTGGDRRQSTRKTAAPARFRPGSSDVPSELLDMIHSVAATAAAKSSVPFDAAAVVALEEALEPCLEALCSQALAHAAKNGRDIFNEADLKAVSGCFLKSS